MMKRRLRRRLLLLTLLLLLLGGGLFLLRGPLLYRPLRKIIQKQAAERIGIKAEIQEVSGDIFSRLKLTEVEVLEIVDLPPGSSIRFESLEVNYNALALAAGKEGWLEEIEILHPEVRLDLRGVTRKAPRLAREEDQEKAGAIRIPAATLRDGEATLLLPWGEVGVSGFHLEIEPAGDSFAGEARLEQVRLRRGEEERVLRDVLLTFQGDGDRVRITELSAKGIPYRLEAAVDLSRRDEGVLPIRVDGEGGGWIRGEISLGQGPPRTRFELNLPESDITPLLDLLLGPGKGRGTIEVAGRVGDDGKGLEGEVRFRGSGGIVGDPLTARLEGALAFEEGRVRIEGVSLASDGAGISLRGSIDPKGSADLQWEAEVTHPTSALHRWIPGVRGKGRARGWLAGPIRSPRIFGEVALSGEIPGSVPPLECAGEFGFGEGILVLEGGSLRSGGSEVRFGATLRLEDEPAFLCEFEGVVDPVSQIWGWATGGKSPLQGSLDVRGAIAGTPARSGGWLDFDLEGGRAGGISLSGLTGRIRGEGGRVSVDSLDARLGEEGGEAALRGEVEWIPGAGLLGRIGRIEFSRGGEKVTGRVPMEFRVEGGAVELPDWSFDTPGGAVALQGGRSSDGAMEASLTASSLDLEGVFRLMGLEEPPRGTVGISAEVHGKPGEFVGRGKVDLRDLAWGGVPGGEGSLRVRWEEGALSLESARITGLAGGEVRARGTLPGGLSGGPLRLTLEARGIDLASLLAPFDPIRLPRGTVHAQLLATGTIGDPYLHGTILLEGGEARLPRPAPPLTGVWARIELGGRRHRLELRSLLGGEEAKVEGEVVLAGLRPESIDLSLGGKNLLLASSRDVRARSDMDLRLQGKPGALRLSGNLHLRRIRYYRDFQAGGGGPPPGAPAEEGVVAGLGPIELDVQVDSEDEVWIDNQESLSRYRVEGEISGTLDRPDLRGTVQCVRGVYRRYGRTFRIESALLGFDGEDLGNPRVDISATTRVSGVGIFLSVRGRVRSPNIGLASDPPYSQADILSLLSLGYTRTGAATAGGVSMALTRVVDWAVGFVGEIFRTRDRDFTVVDKVTVEGSPGDEIGTSQVKVTYEVSSNVTAQAERDRYGHFNFDLFFLRFRF